MCISPLGPKRGKGDAQSSCFISFKMTAFVYVRILMATVDIIIVVILTPNVHVCRDGGSMKFDSVPGGGGIAGIFAGSDKDIIAATFD
jgi:hypothetical protein